jgi:hypothetical protein
MAPSTRTGPHDKGLMWIPALGNPGVLLKFPTGGATFSMRFDRGTGLR